MALAIERHRAVQTTAIVSGLQVTTDSRASVPSFPCSELVLLVKVQKTHPLGIIRVIWTNDELINDAREAGVKLLALVNETMDRLDDGVRALIVSHDGTMIGLEKLLKSESFDSVDHFFGPLQGISNDNHHSVHAFN